MNLWVKRTGQLLVAVLFLVSCEDDTYLLGFQNKNKKFNVRYQEFSLPSTVVLVDSLITDNRDQSARLLVGQYLDPSFGTVRAETYTQFYPALRTTLDPTAVFDSVTIKLRLDFYSYGSKDESEERFTIHEIVSDTLSLYTRYYYNSTFEYNPTPLGEVSYLVNYDTLAKNVNKGASADTLLFQARLDDGFGLRLYNRALVESDLGYNRKDFTYEFKGLAFIPSQSNWILGLNTNSLSEITLHFHTATQDSLRRFYRIGSANTALGFNNITTTRTGDLASIMQPYEGYAPPSGLRYLQNGSPVITKLDISEFYSFITGSADGINDSISNMEINSAELSLSVESPPDGMPPPTDLTFRVMKSDDQYMNSARDTDSTFMAGFYAHTGLIPATGKAVGPYYYPGNDRINDWITLTYDKSKNKYVGYATLFFQSLFQRKELDLKNGVTSPNQIHYLGLIPYAPTAGKTVDRAVINANSVKLKVSYTSPKVIKQ